eukprot:gnl/Chilomastix_caulleri/157.p1 GENE.gnl/Chilomastix_caulleri/157~~gnl/Chilomastix_caulleri/157.p1  ORF type:complete len:171 (-),score=42.41 gnl/Chilomastix_caulleri/157:99-611(-)
MVQYARFKSTHGYKARGSNLKVSFKKTRETANAIKGMNVEKAEKYLKDVLAKKRIVPFRRHNGGVGRHAQCHEHKWAQGRWPAKSAQLVLSMLKNVRSNAEAKGVVSDKLKVTHIKVDRAPGSRRSTFRAHGRITKYSSQPCHIELMCKELVRRVPKGKGQEVERKALKA